MTEYNNILLHSLFAEPFLRYRSEQDTAIMLHHRPGVAIVGSRAATDYGIQVAYEMARDLAEAGVVVISGMAFGIDAAAHRGALSVLGDAGRTIAVLASGCDVPYPRAHTELHRSIIERGMVVSAYDNNAAPSRVRFLERNRVIAQLAQVVVMVESAPRGGSLNCLKHATELGKVIAAVPGSVTSIASQGANRAIRDGAHLVTCANDVLALLEAAA